MFRKWLWILVAGSCLAGCGSKPHTLTNTTPPAGKTSTSKINWLKSYPEALAEAKKSNKLVLVDVGTSWCSGCKRLDENVWPAAEIVKASQNFVPVRVDGDTDKDTMKLLNTDKYPTILFLTSEGKEIERVFGSVPAGKMLKAMERVLKSSASQ